MAEAQGLSGASSGKKASDCFAEGSPGSGQKGSDVVE